MRGEEVRVTGTLTSHPLDWEIERKGEGKVGGRRRGRRRGRRGRRRRGRERGRGRRGMHM